MSFGIWCTAVYLAILPHLLYICVKYHAYGVVLTYEPRGLTIQQQGHQSSASKNGLTQKYDRQRRIYTCRDNKCRIKENQ